MVKSSRFRKLATEVLQVVFGPWHMSPWLTFVSFVLVTHLSTIGRFSGNLPTVDTNLSGAPASLLTGAAFAVPVWLSNRLRMRTGRPLTRVWYLATVVIGATVATAVRIPVLGLYGLDTSFTPEVPLQMALRGCVIALLVFAVAGVNSARLTAQVGRAESALALVQDQQALVFEAEERVRSNVSQFLHDRVQASLVAVGMQLRELATQVDPQSSGQIRSLVEEIETIRTDDVRAAARMLSPDVDGLGLVAALRDLGRVYAPAVDVRVHDQVEGSGATRRSLGATGLAVYRTAEQALLNSVVHGRATKVEVTLEGDSTGMRLTVTDDGSGPPLGPAARGAGTSLMDSATKSVGGHWALTAAPGGGAVMRATFGL